MVILVALDESSFAKAALEKALELAAPGKAEVVALSVVPLPGVVEGAQDRLISRFEREAKTLMDEAKALADSHGLSLKARVESGISPADTILDVAKEIGANLIVVGHRGKSNLERFLIGSVASALVTYAPCSVLVVK